MSISENICIIPAKGTSTRLKRKNILPIGGKPMINYAISAAINSKVFNKNIYVSTEDIEICNIAKKNGAKVPFLRPKKLSFDPFGVKDVILDFLDKMPRLCEAKNLTIILPTCPFITKDDIIRAHELFKNTKSKVLTSITETDHNAQRCVTMKGDYIKPLFNDKIEKKSQELELTYYLNGGITIIDIKTFLATKNFFSHPILPYVLPINRSIDIDTYDDYLRAKYMFENLDSNIST